MAAECEVAGHIAATVRKQGEGCTMLIHVFIHPKTPAHRLALHVFRVSLPPSVKHLWKTPETCCLGDSKSQRVDSQE